MSEPSARHRGVRQVIVCAVAGCALSAVAQVQLAPAVPLGVAMNAQGRIDDNPYAGGMLDLFSQRCPQIAPDRPGKEAAAARRQR